MRIATLAPLLVSGFLAFTGCSNPGGAPGNQATAGGAPSTAAHRYGPDEETVMPLLYQQRAAEYRALCLQAYNVAKARVKKAIAKPAPAGKPYAVITDLDETAIDNSANSVWAYFADSTTGLDELTHWWLKGVADSVPGAVGFFNYLYNNKVDIYYISNRTNRPDIVEATRNNMKQLGFPLTSPADTGHFLFLDSGLSSSKEPRRKKVEAMRTVIVLLGDNLIDLDSAFDGQPLDVRWREVERLRDSFGAKYIAFPNAIYGDWENAFYRGFAGRATIGQKDSMRKQYLDSLEICQSCITPTHN